MPGAAGALFAVRVRITQAWTTMELDGLTASLEQLTAARTAARDAGDEVLLALSRIQESNIRGRVGDWRGSLEALDEVGDAEYLLTPPQRCALHINRGLSHLALGESDAAAAALGTALGLAAEHGLLNQEFKARHNLACLAFVDGDLPRALVLMREADAMDADVSRDRARLDHAEVLLAAGLVARARDVLEDALLTAREEGHRLEVGEISLRLARCDVLVDDLDRAREHVRAATAAYRTRQAEELVADAELVRATIDIAAGRDLPGVVTALTRHNDRSPRSSGPARAASATDREGLRLEAEARLLIGDVDGARRRIDGLDGDPHDSLPGRLHELLLRARLAHARGRGDESARWVADGNRLLAAHQFQSSSLDVRAALALHGRRLSGFDLERALVEDDPDDTLSTVERWRAISHRINPVTTPSDPELADVTRELRLLRRGLAEGGPAAPGLLAGIDALERRISEREWALTVTGSLQGTATAADGEEITAAARARGATLVELFEVAGEVHVLTVTDDGPRLGSCAPVAEVERLGLRLRRDLRARALLPPGSPLGATLARATASSLAAVDALLKPSWAGDGRVVIAPSGAFVAMPWSLLPSLRGRPVTVTPSLTRWLRGPTGRASTPALEPVRALHGPGLARAGPEIRAVRTAWSVEGRAEGADPVAATSEDVVDGLSTARVVHLAAHGSHEAQSPLFSSVRMADGPVFAHEFPRPVVSEHVALSACDVGQFSSRAGDEPLGLAIALVSLGARSVLAAVAPVADDLAADAMVAYHRRLAAGADAAQAWAEVVQDRPDAGVFCLYGSDWSAPVEPVR